MKTKLEKALKRVCKAEPVLPENEDCVGVTFESYNTLLEDAKLIAEQYEKATDNMIQMKMLKELWAQGIDGGGPDVNGDHEICIYYHDKEPQLSRAKSFEDCISIAYAEIKKRKIAMR